MDNPSPCQRQAGPKIPELVARGALFVVNHSGGKDSQAMFHVVRALVPAAQVVVIHADLPGVDWDGTLDHVKATTAGYDLVVAHGTKTFFQMVEHRGMWPSPQRRQCTSDLKRTPIDREIRRYLKRHSRFGGLVVNCMGLRAEESSSRAKAEVLKLSARNSKAGREWYDWLPIHNLMVAQVFAIIADAGQKPHWAYAAGMTRLSCVFCIMASKADLQTAARLNPDLYRHYVETEKRLGQTLMMPSKKHGRRTLEDITGISALRTSDKRKETTMDNPTPYQRALAARDQRRTLSAARIRPKANQKPCDVGLFDLDARRQTDLVDAVRAAEKED